MAMAKTLVLAALLVVAVAPGHVRAFSTDICNMSFENGMECHPTVAKWDAKPDASQKCCEALKKTDLQCMCSYKDSFMLSMYEIDRERAYQLPAKCGLALPSNC